MIRTIDFNSMTAMDTPIVGTIVGSGSGVPCRKTSRETIHSGHFMVSQIDDAEGSTDTQTAQPSHESDYEHGPEMVTDERVREYDLEVECQQTLHTYHYGPKYSNSVLIDGSLTKLFECMTLAYSGKITSPRWKTFKGLKLKLKDKIRLNNIIWRSWHIQYIAGRNPLICQFSATDAEHTHNRPEAVILEGKYWKRRIKTVTAEYKKWRMYSQKKGTPMTPSRPSNFDWERWHPWSSGMTPAFNSDDDFTMDFDDKFFNTLITPSMIEFPNPREIARAGMSAEFIQPGLVQLQPTFDDFMDTFEPLQDLFFNSKNITPLPILPEESTVEHNSANQLMITQQDNQKMDDSISFETSNLDTDILSTLLGHDTSTQMPMGSSKRRFNQNSKQNSLESRNSQRINNVNNSCVSQIPPQFKDDVSKSMQLYSSLNTPTRTMGTHTSEVPLRVNQSIIQSTDSSFPVSGGVSLSTYGITDSPNSGQYKDSPSKPKYFASDLSSNEKFVSPKAVRQKQRSRSRSISSPQGTNDKQMPGSVLTPQTAMSLIDINTVNTRQNSSPIVERSVSLPVYTRERKTNIATIVSQNSQLTNEQIGHITQSYPQHAQMPQETFKMPSREQPNDITHTTLYSPQQILLTNNIPNNSYGLSTQESNAIISQLLSSGINNNNSGVRTSPLLYSAIQSNTAFQHEHSQSLFPNDGTQRAQKTSNTTVDSTCIGIPVTTVTTTDGRSQSFIFSNLAFKDINNLQQNLTHSLMVQSAPDIYSQVSSPLRSRSSPGTPVVSKDVLFAVPSVSPPLNSITPPPKVIKLKSFEERTQYKEHRRVCHINAEQKRRCNIKNGFDTLRSLLPSMSQNSSTKVSKAAMLQKAAEHIRALKNERQHQQEEYEILKQQIESLNQTIGVFQNQLPATGVPVSCQRTNQTKELYENYTKMRTLQNPKFWIFSIIMEPLLDSYNNTVATTNVDEMCKTLLRWLDQNCCLVTLRRDVLNSLRYLSTSTNILTNPSSLAEEAIMAVTKKEKQKGN